MFLARSLIPVVRVTVKVVLKSRGAPGEGVNVAVAPFTERVPVIGGFGPARRLKVSVVTEDGSIGSLKVAVSAEVVATLVAPLEGLVPVTIGAVVSGAVPVVKVQVRGAPMGTPDRSLMPLVNVTV